MTSLVLALLLAGLAAQSQATRTTAPAPPPSASPDEPQPLAVEAEPDVLLRGHTTSIVVTGNDPAALKTLKVNPAAGITIGEIKELPARAGGLHAVSVSVTVAADAAPGEREITAIVTPILGTSNATRSADDPRTKQMEQAFQQIVKDNTRAEPVGTIYVNSHELAVTSLTAANGSVRIAVSDAAGDVESRAPRPAPAAESTGGIVLMSAPSDLVQSEARCGRDIYDSILDEPVVRERQGSTTVIAATLDEMVLDGQHGCELRVRVRDAAGNVSRWSAMKID